MFGCRGKSETGRVDRIKAAKSLCGPCVEREKCLAWAVENKEPFGIWGGYTERERAKMRITNGKAIL